MATTAEYPTFDKFGDNGTLKLPEWREFWDSLTETQQQRIKDKAEWEGCTLTAVLYDWPSILEGVDPNALMPNG